MIGYLVLASALAFFLFLVPGPHQRYAGIAGWAGMVLVLVAMLPEFAAENNFVYPVITLASIPFLFLTARRLLAGDERVAALTRGAAIAFVLYVPFAYIPSLGDWLIGVVTNQVAWLLTLIGFPYEMWAWNIFIHNGLRVEIILACTGIQSIAIMLGVAFAVPATLRQRALAFLAVAPVIYALNLLRNVFVIIAYTDQWFPYLPADRQQRRVRIRVLLLGAQRHRRARRPPHPGPDRLRALPADPGPRGARGRPGRALPPRPHSSRP